MLGVVEDAEVAAEFRIAAPEQVGGELALRPDVGEDGAVELDALALLEVDDGVDAGARRRVEDVAVLAAAAVEEVGALAADEDIVAGAALEDPRRRRPSTGRCRGFP